MQHWLTAETERWCNLAFDYECGNGVPKDDNQAAFWYRKAADQGDADAQFMLAVMYREGRGVPRDPEQAVSWFRKSADQGDVGAQIELGSIYETGEIIPKDYAQAAYWYLKVAVLDGWYDVQFRLGQMYENGLGVPKDREQAARWYRKAAEQYGDERAKAALTACGAGLDSGTEATAVLIPPASLWKGREGEILTLKTPRGTIEKWQLIGGTPQRVGGYPDDGYPCVRQPELPWEFKSGPAPKESAMIQQQKYLDEARRIAQGCPVGYVVIHDLNTGRVYYRDDHSDAEISTNFTGDHVDIASHELGPGDPDFLAWDRLNSEAYGPQLNFYTAKGK